MSKNKKQFSPEEVAQLLRIKIDGQDWSATKIKRKFNDVKEEYIYMVVTNGVNTQVYLVNRLDILKSWSAVNRRNELVYERMRIQMNRQRWHATSLSIFNEDCEEWFQMDIINKKNGIIHSIAIERESLIAVYVALFRGIGDIVVDVIENVICQS